MQKGKRREVIKVCPEGVGLQWQHFGGGGGVLGVAGIEPGPPWAFAGGRVSPVWKKG